MSIVYIRSRLPPEVASYPQSPPKLDQTSAHRRCWRWGHRAGAVGQAASIKCCSSISDTLAPGLGTHFGAEGVLPILKHTTQVSATSTEYAKIMS